jgi:hypothetical protein
MKTLVVKKLLEHPEPRSRLTGEQTKRLIAYAQGSFFKHLRLYDYVLKNTKSAQKKYITITQQKPNCGPKLDKGMIIEDKVTRRFYDQEDSPSKMQAGLTIIEEGQESMPTSAIREQQMD